ncbi:MAG TPA: bifunctional homocysteine S-methyltransferase/methylenetetrahydrofolate reductase, partial [Thermoanaerobaculia bacterium]|nr:bifunctional homocysteine S-methyltransferase/methylenetetrahydrofolate reductase [Thermoanaerobaculia bacterium]
VSEINGAAVKLARQAREVSGKEVFIGGSMGPSWLPYEPDDPDSELAVRALFREQARALDARGVDFFLLETFVSLWEIRIALETVREVSGLPVVASMTFPGDSWEDKEDTAWPEQAARRLAALGADVIGANCSLGPRDMVTVVSAMARVPDVRLFAAPNTGTPRYLGGRFVYPDSSPEYFAWFAAEAAKRGARMIGGCCGSTPEHVRAIAEALAGVTPERIRTAPETIVSVFPRDVRPVREKPSGIAARLAAHEFVVSMQLDPPKGTDPEAIVDAARAFFESGAVHAVDINSNPLAHLHMDSLWMALRLEREGIETIPHVTPRDASLMGLTANLLGAWGEGIKNLLVITGDPSQRGDRPGATDVYQTDSVGLVKVIADVNDGRDTAGNPIGDPPNFFVGVAVNPAEPDLDREVDRFLKKVDNGAHFAMTQVFFEWSVWERFVARLGGRVPIPVLVAVWPLTSHRLALRVHNEVPGITVPDAVLSMLERAGANARREGFALAKDLLAEARRRVEGVYVIAPFKNPASALELL